MSSKSCKSVNSDSKPRAKAILLMLEKLISGGNPDKEQTRYLCQKLLHLTNNHEAAKKEISSKSGLDIILSILETCGDQATCLTLLNTLNEIASGNGVKRLVSHDVTRVLLHTVAYLGKEGDNRLLTALLNLSVKIAPKDRRFALRVRLAGALPVLLSIVRSSTSHTSNNKLLASTLLCLKICSSNGVNASVLGRLGAIHVLHRLSSSLGRKQPALMKTALATLSLLIKSSRSCASHAIANGLMAHILAIHQDWHKNDLRCHRHIPARKSMLNIIKHLTALKNGKKAFLEIGGLKIIHRTCKECLELPCPKAAEPLLSVGTLILRRCQQRFRLPIPTVQCSFKFQLPNVKSEELQENDETSLRNQFFTYLDDVIDESDEDDEDEDDEDVSESLENCLDAENEESKKQDAKPQPSSHAPVFIPPVDNAFVPKRSLEDLRSMYEEFFPELQEFKFTTEMKNRNMQTDEQQGDSKVLPELVINGYPQPDHGHASYIDVNTTNHNRGTLYGDQNHTKQKDKVISSPQHKMDSMISRTHSANNIMDPCTVPNKPEMYKPPASAPNPSAHSDRQKNFDSFLPMIVNSRTSSCSNACEDDRDDEHSSLMAELSSNTKSSKQVVNNVSYADLLGHGPPPFSQHQVVKRYGVQRVKMLEDVARTLGHGDIINKVVYSRDGSYKPPRTNDYSSYDVLLPRMSLSSGVQNGQESISQKLNGVCENQSIDTPVIQDACCFPLEASEDCLTTKLPIVSSGCAEEPYSFQSNAVDARGLKSPLQFSSDFECGNLRTAIQVREREYDLILDADCNCNHHHQWFYFEVSNVNAGVPYRFNIVNCEKSNSQFNFGMQPLMYSVTEAQLGRPCWRRGGTNLCYYKSHFSRSAASAGGVKGRSYFMMTFSVTFHHQNDICYFAYHYPYTYTQMQADIQELVSQVDQDDVFVRVQNFCTTLGGNPVPVLTVTARPCMGNSDDDEDAITEFRSRPYIFLSSRVHPGESNSSWTMRGTLKLLLSSRKSTSFDSKMLDVADQLRRSYIFKIVPMLNPDGVINGHHRCSLTGEDLNRQWMEPDPNLFPTIYHTKGLLQYLHSIGKAPLVYCDYHGHSRRKNVFMYGCSRRESVLAGETDALYGAPDDVGYKALPKLLHQLAPAFSLSNCNFVVERCKESTARVVVWKEMGVARSYTMESTYCGCDQGKYKSLQIGTFELEEMGAKLCEGFLHLKVRDRARRLPYSDFPPNEYDGVNNNSNISPLYLPTTSDLESVKDLEWRRHLSRMRSDQSGNSVRCPANSDEEFTPEDGGSVESFEAVNGDQRDMPRSYLDNPLIGNYSREFWDYNEFCCGFGFGSDEDGSELTAEPEVTSLTGDDSVPARPAHFSVTGSHVMRSAYQICPDTGRVLYDDTSTNQLAQLMENNSLQESSSPSKYGSYVSH